MHLINANFRVVKQQRTTELEVLTDNVKKIKVSYPLGNNDHYIDVLKILKPILNDDLSTDSDGKVDDMYHCWK